MSYAKALLLVVIILSNTNQSAGEAPVQKSQGEIQNCPSATVVSTSNLTAVVKYRDIPTHDGEAYGSIDWGDGFVGGGGCYGHPIGEMCCIAFYSHVYDCPGRYTIVVCAYPFYDCNIIGAGTVTIQPLGGFELFVTSEGHNEVHVETADVINPSKIVESTVDWGDGSPVEPFAWTAYTDSTLCLPPHTYANLGDFDISVINRYGGDCPFERSDSLRVRIETLTPVDHRSWGAIKVLYR